MTMLTRRQLLGGAGGALTLGLSGRMARAGAAPATITVHKDPT